MVTDLKFNNNKTYWILPKLKFGDILDVDADTKKFPGKENDGENVFFNLQEKPDANGNPIYCDKIKKLIDIAELLD